MSTLDGILRASYPKALAALVRVTGSLSEAEDLLQDATVKALVRWREDGVPDSPDAWLVRTANNKAIDGFRRQAIERKHTESVRADDTPQDRSFEPQDLVLPDDLIRLVFICCHPELKRESQIALALKVLGGLSIGEIARAFLVAPRTIEQRITRAKRRLHDRGVPYEVPSPKELPARLAAVLSVIHLIFRFLSRIGATWAGLMAYKPRIVSDLRGRRAPSVSGEELQAPGRSGHTSQLNRDGAASSKGAAQSARGSAPAWNVGESRGRVRWLSRFVAM